MTPEQVQQGSEAGKESPLCQPRPWFISRFG